MKFKRIIIQYLNVVFLILINNLYAQPLEFYDIMDSATVYETKVNYTSSDSGWISTSLVRDSVLLIAKYDYCGKLKYQKVFTIDTFKLSELNTTIESSIGSSGNSDSLYISCTVHSPEYNGIFCLIVHPYNGDYKIPQHFTIPNKTIFSNPKIVVNNNERLLFFNAGNHIDSLSGHLMRLDNNLTVLSSIFLDDYIPIRDLIPIDNNNYMVTMGDRLIGKLFNTLQFEYVYTLDSHYTHFNQNLSNSLRNNISFIGDYKQQANENTIGLLKFNYNTHSIDFSNNLVRYNPEVIPTFKYYNNIVENSSENYIITHLTSFGTNTLHANSIYRGKNLVLTSAYKPSNNYRTKSLSADYLSAENNFVLNGSYYDSSAFFQAKLNKSARLKQCSYISITNTIKLDSFGLDTFSQLHITPFSNPTINSTISNDTFTINLTRECKYFDFIIDTSMIPICRGNTDTSIIVSVKSNDPISITNPFVRYLWSDKVNTSTIDSITYDPSSKSYLSQFVIIKYCDETDTSFFIPMLVDCPPTLKLANVFVPNSQEDINKQYGLVMDDLAKLRIKTIKWSIFNRWGTKVFESKSYNEEWNGLYKEKDAPADTYVVTIQILDIYNHSHSFKKMFTLIR
ncbi:MAG: gliding motility-associated C-terminal domain-containing protein [Saprospiraceae bacterium]|nr:gliding motility-associated C-terminal domain-containing protein [Saprospiraceae bacterium]